MPDMDYISLPSDDRAKCVTSHQPIVCVCACVRVCVCVCVCACVVDGVGGLACCARWQEHEKENPVFGVAAA